MMTKRRVPERAGWIMALGALLLFSACSEKSPRSIFDPEIGHPENWADEHRQAALSEGSTCPECHGADLRGGVSDVSCFTPLEGGRSCHESGTGSRHTAGWSLDSEHGRAAKARPGISSGLGSWQASPGNDYRGGTSDVACSSCHGVPAPHPESPWLHSPNSHATANEQNAPFCAECHLDPGSGQPDGCFNGSLCHGEEGYHAPEWEDPGRHGAEAKGGPETGGFDGCRECHGEDFDGGSSQVSCFSCHNLEAPHPLGWADGLQSHRTANERNAPLCAECHQEISPDDGCFTNNACHGTAADEETDSGANSESSGDASVDNSEPPSGGP